MDALKPQAEITAILQFAYVWTAGTSRTFGVTPFCEQIMVHPGGGSVGFVADPDDKTETDAAPSALEADANGMAGE